MAQPPASDVILSREGTPASDEKDVTLYFYGFKADAMNLTSIEKNLKSFMDENKNVNVVYEGVKGNKYHDILKLRREAGTLDDILMLNHDECLDYAKCGELVDLSGSGAADNYCDFAKEQFTDKDGKVYFLPMSISIYGLYINYDLLAENGLEVPKNYAEFAKECEYFKQKGITPVIANNYASIPSIIQAAGLYNVYQGEDAAQQIESFNKNPDLLADALSPGIDLASEVIGRGFVDAKETLETEQTSDDLDLFAEGERPFMITGAWASQRLQALSPGFSYGVHPLPFLPDGNVIVISIDTCIGINAKSEHIEDAKALIVSLTSDESLYDYCRIQSCFSPTADMLAPDDITVAPCTDDFKDGKYVLGSDYKLEMPIRSALATVGEELLKGMDRGDAFLLLMELLKER